VKTKTKAVGYLNRKLQDPVYRARFEKASALFKLEMQILLAMEDRGWTFADLAKAVGTSKGNISRDLNSDRMNSATVKRLTRIADALEMRFLPLFVPKRSAAQLETKIRALLAA
jgi:transcriptional regulator with XRE-family HTH domain